MPTPHIDGKDKVLATAASLNEQVIAVEPPRYVALASVACMGLEVARRPASVMETIGMARERRRRSKQ